MSGGTVAHRRVLVVGGTMPTRRAVAAALRDVDGLHVLSAGSEAEAAKVMAGGAIGAVLALDATIPSAWRTLEGIAVVPIDLETIHDSALLRRLARNL